MKMRSFTCVLLDSLCDCKYVDRQQQTDSSALTNKLKMLNYGCVVRALFAVHAYVQRLCREPRYKLFIGLECTPFLIMQLK